MEERDRLARLTRKGIGMPMAGFLYWVGVAFVVRELPRSTALVVCFALTGAVFPVGALLTRLLGGDLFAKTESLTSLGLLLAAVQLFYWPIVIMVFRQAPDWTPYAMVVLFSSHFLPYLWLYRSRGYALLAAGTAVTATVLALFTGANTYFTAPVAAAGCYAVAVAILWRELRLMSRPVAG